MADFNNLFGKDRDVVQETSAQTGQKLRVAANGTELEGFDLAVETIAGGATGGTSFNLVNTLGTPAGFNSIVVDDLFDGLDMVGKTARFSFNSDPQETFSMGQSVSLNVTTELNQSGAVIPVGSYIGTITEVSGTSFSNPDFITVGFEGVTGWSNGTIQNLTGTSSGTVAFNVTVTEAGTTVTGDLTVTGLEAGNVVSDANGNLSIGSGGGVSGTASFFPIFDSSDDGVGDSAMSQQDRSNHAGVTTVRIGGIGGQLYSGFGRLTNSFDGATVIIPVTANSFPDQGNAFFHVPGGSGFHGPLQYTTVRNGSGDGIFKSDESFSTNTGAYTGDFISFQVGDSFAQLTTLRAELTAAADTTTLTLGGSGNINLGFEVAVSSDFIVQTYGDINLDTALTMSGDLDVAGATQLSGNTSVGGTLTVTGTIDGPLIGAIRNINPVAGTGGIAQDFRIWAGTQSEFDTQFDNDGSGTISGTPAASDGSVVYIITNN